MISLSIETVSRMSVNTKQRSWRWILSPAIVLGIHTLILLYIFWQPKPEIAEEMPAAAPIVITMAALPSTSQPATLQSQARQATALPAPAEESSHLLDTNEKVIKNAEVQAAVRHNTSKQSKKVITPAHKVPVRHPPLKQHRKTPVQVRHPDKMTTPASVKSNSSERLSQQNQAPKVGAASNQLSDSPQNWQSEILSRLEQAKRYPAYARRMHQEDIIMVRFTVDRTGEVLNSTVIKSQGYAALDREAQELPERVSPLPAPPASDFKNGASDITLNVPVAFVLH